MGTFLHTRYAAAIARVCPTSSPHQYTNRPGPFNLQNRIDKWQLGCSRLPWDPWKQSLGANDSKNRKACGEARSVKLVLGRDRACKLIRASILLAATTEAAQEVGGDELSGVRLDADRRWWPGVRDSVYRFERARTEEHMGGVRGLLGREPVEQARPQCLGCCSSR